MKQEERYKHYYNEGYNAGSVKGYEQAIKNACEWLHTALYLDHERSIEHRYATLEELLNDFRKAMKGEEDEDHIIDANKKVDRVIGTADHIKTALDVLNKKGGEE